MVNPQKKKQMSDLLKVIHFLDLFENNVERSKKKLSPATYKKIRNNLSAAHRQVKAALEAV